jgi:hypothetical protein
MLLRMYKEEQEEKSLLQKMRNFQITQKEEDNSMLWSFCKVLSEIEGEIN